MNIFRFAILAGLFYGHLGFWGLVWIAHHADFDRAAIIIVTVLTVLLPFYWKKLD